jgi:hypothetical protein
MTEHEASRTLVKSPPELWAECSDAGSLARHLGEFGEIKITRLEPETAVAWEGERVSGTVRIEPSGWGTRVTLTAQVAGEAAVPVGPAPGAEPAPGIGPAPGVEPAAQAEPEPVPSARPAAKAAPESLGPPPRFGFFARVRELFKPERALAEVAPPEPAPDPEPPEPPEPAPEPEPPSPPEPAPEPEPPAPPEPEPAADASTVLVAALDSLGQAHHRPYSRS